MSMPSEAIPGSYLASQTTALNHRQGNRFLQDRYLDCFIFPPFASSCFFVSFLNLLLLRTPWSERTNQAPTATVSTYRKHSRAVCNWPYTGQHSTYSSTLVSTRQQSATTQASRQEQVLLPTATMNVLHVYPMFPFFLAVVVL